MALSLTKCFYLYCSLQSEQIRAFISTMFLFQTLPSLFKFPSQRQEKSHNSIELIGKRKKVQKIICKRYNYYQHSTRKTNQCFETAAKIVQFCATDVCAVIWKKRKNTHKHIRASEEKKTSYSSVLSIAKNEPTVNYPLYGGIIKNKKIMK